MTIWGMDNPWTRNIRSPVISDRGEAGKVCEYLHGGWMNGKPQDAKEAMTLVTQFLKHYN